jgi:BirA family transcriptional regulator, biotin operon repressor / biotin---[acetyl-CoA-carboxylase] ligase
MNDTTGRQLTMKLDASSAPYVEFVAHIDSTNSELMRRFAAGNLSPQALCAKAQSAGRGRNGKSWENSEEPLLYSQLLQLRCRVDQARGLSLALGVEAAEVVEALCAEAFPASATPSLRVQLKWPNDLWIDTRKLGGLLLEVARAQQGQLWLIAGLGLNRVRPESSDPHWQERAALSDWLSPALLPTRQALAHALCTRWHAAAAEYAEHGVAPWLERWRARDALYGMDIVLSDDPRPLRAAGITPQGALIARDAEHERRIDAGEVSLSTRLAAKTSHTP